MATSSTSSSSSTSIHSSSLPANNTIPVTQVQMPTVDLSFIPALIKAMNETLAQLEANEKSQNSRSNDLKKKITSIAQQKSNLEAQLNAEELALADTRKRIESAKETIGSLKSKVPDSALPAHSELGSQQESRNKLGREMTSLLTDVVPKSSSNKRKSASSNSKAVDPRDHSKNSEPSSGSSKKAKEIESESDISSDTDIEIEQNLPQPVSSNPQPVERIKGDDLPALPLVKDESELANAIFTKGTDVWFSKERGIIRGKITEKVPNKNIYNVNADNSNYSINACDLGLVPQKGQKYYLRVDGGQRPYYLCQIEEVEYEGSVPKITFKWVDKNGKLEQEKISRKAPHGIMLLNQSPNGNSFFKKGDFITGKAARVNALRPENYILVKQTS